MAPSRPACDLAVVLLRMRMQSLDRRTIERARQVTGDGIQQRLHAAVVERAAAIQRLQHPFERGRPQRFVNAVDRDLLPFEVSRHDLIIEQRDGIDEL